MTIRTSSAPILLAGAGLQLSANATSALQLLGVGPAVRAIAAQPEGKEMRLWSTGQTWKLFDLGQHSVEEYGYPYLMVYRPDLYRVSGRCWTTDLR